MNETEARRDNEISAKEAFGKLCLSTLMIAGNIYVGEVRDNTSAKIALFTMVIFSLIGISLIIFMYATKGIIPRRKDLVDLVLSMGFISLYIFVPVFFISQIFLISVSLQEFSIPVITQSAFIISSLVLLVGSILFYIRLKFRFVYGASEVIVGLYVAFEKIHGAPLPVLTLENIEPVALVILTGAIYLVVRGLDNAHQGMTKEIDPIGRHVFRWFESVTRSSTKL
jgi:hypothetical protein